MYTHVCTSHVYGMCMACVCPQVLKIKILAARKLQDFPNLQPRCEVQVRTIRGQIDRGQNSCRRGQKERAGATVDGDGILLGL